MQLISINTSTELLLDQWGKWSRSGLGLGIGTPSNDNYCVIDDGLALLIDSSIARLKRNNPQIQAVIFMRYRDDYTYGLIAKHIRTSDTMAKRLVEKGIAWVDGNLDKHRKSFDCAA